MKVIHAIYENGVFRPEEAVNLEPGTRVVIETEEAAAERMRAARRHVSEILSHRYDDGQPSDAENHNETRSSA